jgi:hypothetical protein
MTYLKQCRICVQIPSSIYIHQFNFKNVCITCECMSKTTKIIQVSLDDLS